MTATRPPGLSDDQNGTVPMPESPLRDDPLLDADAPRWTPTARVRQATELGRLVRSDRSARERLRRLAETAAGAVGAEGAQVSILADRQVAAVTIRSGADGQVPSDGAPWPFENTVCVLALRTNAAVVIDDAALDERVSSIPAVTSGLLGSYLGAPLRDPNGAVLGVLCVHNSTPVTWSDDDLAEVLRLADLVSAELCGVRAAAAVRSA